MPAHSKQHLACSSQSRLSRLRYGGWLRASAYADRSHSYGDASPVLLGC
jgi:hypothetical protein